MRSVLFLALSLLLCSYTGYRKCETCAKSDLKGKVKKLTEYIVTGDKNALTGEYKYEQQVYHYNKKGLLVRKADSSYVYDKITKRGVSNVYVERYAYKKGRLQTITSGPERSPVVQKFAYDGIGRRVASEQYPLVRENEWNRADRTVNIMYLDDDAIITRKALESGNMKVVSKERVIDDAKGRKVMSKVYIEREGDYRTSNTYAYDASDNIVEEKLYNTFNGEVQSSTGYVYDAQGRLGKEVKTMAGGTIHTTTYDYSNLDKQGNYLKVSIATDNQPPIITHRLIDYY